MPTLMELLEAGAHFGHKKERSHPKAKEYIFTLREGVYVIDLDKTKAYLEKALTFLKQQASLGKTILFVGTKRQAKELIKTVAGSTNMPYINRRWLGGTLTNFTTIRRNLQNLESLENQTKSPDFQKITKKEQKMVNDKLTKLIDTFGGVRAMKNLPDVIFVVDANKEKLAVTEANITEIPLVAIADTDANPDEIQYPIPANDDAPKTLELLMGLVEKAILEGQGVQQSTTKTEAPKEIAKAEIVEDNRPKADQPRAGKEEIVETKEEPKIKEATKKDTTKAKLVKSAPKKAPKGGK